jgi:hypothetical protein
MFQPAVGRSRGTRVVVFLQEIFRKQLIKKRFVGHNAGQPERSKTALILIIYQVDFR